MVGTSQLVTLGFTALAAAGFASITQKRVQLALQGHREGHRFEMIRSGVVAAIMALFAGGAAYGVVMQALALFAARH